MDGRVREKRNPKAQHPEKLQAANQDSKEKGELAQELWSKLYDTAVQKVIDSEEINVEKIY